MNIWIQEFEPSYVRDDGVMVIHDKDIPLPDGFMADPKLRSNVIFPPGTRAGDHYHQEREEVFVGVGEGMELVIKDPTQSQVFVYKMACVKGLIAFFIQPGLAHAVRNVGKSEGYLIELANKPMEKVPYPISDQ